LVRKTLSFSKQTRLLEAASNWEDALSNFTRQLENLAPADWADPNHPAFVPRTPAIAAGLTDHSWTCKELLTTVLVSLPINTIGRLPNS
jgi:hypothetical protein